VNNGNGYRFRFAGTLAKTSEEKENPWLLLSNATEEVPGFVEQNTAMWQLKKGLGDIVEVPDETGNFLKVRLVGFLKDSPFQSEILIGDAAFKKAFPRIEGHSYFLFDVESGNEKIITALTRGMANYGFAPATTKSKVAAYLAVQNTYLSTFQLLGGFGLLLGSIGLAVVLLRNAFERRGEYSLLRAMGYRARDLARIAFIENASLLILGLLAGIVSATISVIPHIAAGTAIPWLRLSMMLLVVLLVGLTTSAIATSAMLRGMPADGMRRE
jgi:putative ABC transport system permease protein